MYSSAGLVSPTAKISRTPDGYSKAWLRPIIDQNLAALGSEGITISSRLLYTPRSNPTQNQRSLTQPNPTPKNQDGPSAAQPNVLDPIQHSKTLQLQHNHKSAVCWYHVSISGNSPGRRHRLWGDFSCIMACDTAVATHDSVSDQRKNVAAKPPGHRYTLPFCQVQTSFDLHGLRTAMPPTGSGIEATTGD